MGEVTVKDPETQDHLDKVEVELKGGEVHEGDLPIGADRLFSSTRDMYWEDERWAEATTTQPTRST